MSILQEIVFSVVVLVIFFGAIALTGWWFWRRFRRRLIAERFKRHFHPASFDRLAITDRQFPFHIRVDLQAAIEEFLCDAEISEFVSVHTQIGFGGGDFASLLDESLMQIGMASTLVPPQYEEIDIGETQPVRSLQNGLWLAARGNGKFAILYSPLKDLETACGGGQRVRIQIATVNDESGRQLSEAFFRELELAILNARSYRGKVLSFETDDSYRGQSVGIKVQALRKVARDEVILPEKTIELLDRNVIQFVERRSGLAQSQMATKKGLLFYGPPGTGKTHTIRYLANALAGHTTFLISAEQVGFLGEYLTLARLLQPSLIVLEDVDLIARERTRMRHVQSELLLNKLLNEMDGLREDSDIIFILTTNRPEELEAALASRPGRIDQAIEFPLPDADGRRKLARLYGRGWEIPDEVITDIAGRTERVSAAFIKELMRRTAQWRLSKNGSRTLTSDDVRQALDEMLLSGGSLNLKLLGAQEWVDR